jgi:putative peptidoglycan lipid II flippase
MSVPKTNADHAPNTATADRPGGFIHYANLISKLTFLSRIFGLLRDKACGYFLGVGTTWSAFWMGFQFPNLFRRIFGEGALTAVFLPVYTRLRQQQGQEAANQLARAIVVLLTVVLVAIMLVGEAMVAPLALSHAVSSANRLAAGMIALMLPYSVYVCLVALLGAIAASHERFAAQAAAPIILNIAMALAAAIPVLIWTWRYPVRLRVIWVAVAVLIAGMVQLLLMFIAVKRAGVRLSGGWRIIPPNGGGTIRAAIGEIVRAMLPMTIGLSVVQLNVFMDSQIAWWFSPDGHAGRTIFGLLGMHIHTPLLAGALGKLSVAQRIYMLPVGIFGVATATAVFPRLSAAAGRPAEVKQILQAALRKSLFLSIPATAGMILIAHTLITAIYMGGRVSADDVDRATWAARWFCAGIWAFEIQMLLVRVFYAHRDAATPMKIAVAMVFLNLALNLLLIWFMQVGGLAASTSISAVVQVGVLAWLVRKRFGPLEPRAVGPLVGKSLLATALMTLFAWIVNTQLRGIPMLGPGHRLLGALVRLPAVVLTAAIVYGLASRWLGVAELAEAPVIRIFRRKNSSPAGPPNDPAASRQ